MYSISVVAIGKDKDQFISEGLAHYQKLLKRFCRLEIIIVPPPRNSSALTVEQLKIQEAEAIRKVRHERDTVVALSDRGKQFSSEQFSKWLITTADRSQGRLLFLIGGPHGLSDDLIKESNSCLSLSPLTMSHQLVRLVLCEQLYRGFSIAAGTDYHK